MPLGTFQPHASALADIVPPAAEVEGPAGAKPPVRRIEPNELRLLGDKLGRLFTQYVSDRRIAELRWLRDQRQYLGIWDPEIEKEFSANRSKAYPRVTRVKCISVLSRLMHLMFPGDERNWEIRASPSPDMSVEDVREAIAEQQKKDQVAGVQSTLDTDYVVGAVKNLAESRAEQLSTLIDDQLQELGGDQTLDYVSLCRRVLQSGVIYGLGVLRGPYAKPQSVGVWSFENGQVTVKRKTIYKPMFEFLKIWDFYPDLSAKTFAEMDGYFTRVVMSRTQVRALADREDFFEDVIKTYLKNYQMGNYRPQPFETELRAMGVKVNVNEMKTETSKYEVIVWHGQTSGTFLRMAGVDVADDKLADDLDAEIWLIDANVIKATLNPWTQLGVKVQTIHTFLFDEDDTSAVGFGLPNSIRDSQMAIAASARMLLDNASVTCGPQLELNTDLLRPDQDLGSTSAYKIWYREGSGQDAQFPAVRNVVIDAHLSDLMKVIELWMKFADAETFVGPATGGDMDKSPSEPLRTAAGASMLRGDAALPFKDIVRNFDQFTMSVLESLVQFNRKFNPDRAQEGDYNVIARGATSLIAKEVRGMQIDQMVATLKPEEQIHVDMRKLVKQRFAVRDMLDLLVSDEEADRRQAQLDQKNQKDAASQQEMIEAQIRQILSDAYKAITQGQKNAATADATSVNTALDVLERGLSGGESGGGAAAETGSGDRPPGGGQGQPGHRAGPGLGLPPPQPGQGPAGGMPAPGLPAPPGGGPGL